MNKTQLLNKIDAAWTALRASYAGLPESKLEEPNAVGEWSVKDVLGHVTTWEEEALKYLPLILEGKRPPRYKDLYGGIDAFNNQRTAHKRSLALAEVLEQLDGTHRRLIAYIETAPDEELVRDTRFRRRIRLDTYSHYPAHTKAIHEWRAR